MTAPSGLVSGDVMVAWVAQNTSGLPAVERGAVGLDPVLEQDDGSSIGTRSTTGWRRRRTCGDDELHLVLPAVGPLRRPHRGVQRGVHHVPRRASASQANGASGSTRRPRSRRGREHDAARAVRGRLRQRDYGHPAGTTSAFAGPRGPANGIAIGAFYESLSASTASGQVQSSGNNSATNVGATLALQSAAGGGGGGSAASGFNAVDGYLSSYPASTAAQRIYTKLAGTGFTLTWPH